MALQADIRHSMTELQEMHQEFEVTKHTTSAHVCLPASHCGFLFLYFLLAMPVLSLFLCLLWVSLATRRKPNASVSPHLQVSQVEEASCKCRRFSKQSKPVWVLDVKSIASTKYACIKYERWHDSQCIYSADVTPESFSPALFLHWACTCMTERGGATSELVQQRARSRDAGCERCFTEAMMMSLSHF